MLGDLAGPGRSRPSAPELAAELDPTPASATLALLHRSGCEVLADQLHGIAALLRSPERRIVFAGHFSCGKSTLINSLIRRDLLPTGDLPETGVPCVLQSGPADRIYSVNEGGRGGLPFGTASIAHEVSLVDGAGEYRRHVHEVDRVVVCLRGGTPPPGVLWIDSPGINDTPAMTRRAAEVADSADVLLWVVTARQPISQVEQEFLRGYVATHGAESLSFVVNVFLPEHTRAAWTPFVRKRAAYLRGRIADTGVCGDAAPTVVLACAPALGRVPDDFGGPEVGALLASAASPEGPSGRRHLAGQQLEALAEDVRRRVADERARVDRMLAAREREIHRDQHQRPRFGSALAAWMDMAFARYEAMVFHATDDVIRVINDSPLHHDDRYGALLTQHLAAITGALADELVVEVNRCAAAHDLGLLTPRAVAWLGAILYPQPLAIPVPAHRVVKGMSAVGAVLGGVLGTFVAPGAGSAVGATLGAAAGGVLDVSASAEARDRAAAVANARGAGQAAATWLRSLQPMVLDLVTSPRSIPPVLPAPASTSTVEALEALQGHLSSTAETLRRPSASAAVAS